MHAPRLTVAASYEAAAGRHYPRHRHTVWEVIYYRSGHIACILEDGPEPRTIESRPGQVLVIPPRTIHQDRVHTDFSQYYIRLERPTPLKTWPETTSDDSDYTLGHLFGLLVREWSARPAPERDELLALLVRQLEILLERKSQEAPNRSAEELVREAERRLEARLTDPPTVSALAHELAVSPSTLRAHFAQVRGYAPLHYLQRLRLERALELIRSSTLNLEDIATLCGYYSASHLNRNIRRATGQTPGHFRPARSGTARGEPHT